MRTELVTEDMIAGYRELARLDPAVGVPELAHGLNRFGWQVRHEQPTQSLPYFEEAADLWRVLAADGAAAHLASASRAFASLAQLYSYVHDDERALAARHQAAAYARRASPQPADVDTRVLMALASGLAEAGQFAQAATVQREVVDSHRTAGPQNGPDQSTMTMWALLDLAIYLDLAGETDASLDIERAILAQQRHEAEADPTWLPILAIWTAGSSVWFAENGHPKAAHGLLRESVAACEQLPSAGSDANYQFRRAVQGALFARSGTRDERPRACRPTPVGVAAHARLQPVAGLSLHRWAFSLRETYRAGLLDIDEAIAAHADRLPPDTDRLAELGTLTRRRAIRASVLFDLPRHVHDEMTLTLARSVELERELHRTAPGPESSRRLVRALTDQAMGHLATGDYATATDDLREALAVHATADSA
ncbi:hypothetical protein GCM10009827_094170 [Dactylosporangium maewongense]|uniref:Uncharacterized protein n=1 Tax=Dactylosporangium maewongense TaxID=634393 RepID=A0ABN2CL65_9ACTN